MGMENSSQRIPLILLSLLFVILGIFLIISISRGYLLPNKCLRDFKVYSVGGLVSKEGDRSCYCTSGKVVCSVNKDDSSASKLQISDFSRNGIDFSYKYFSSGVSSELLSKKLGVSFRSVVTSSKSISVEVIQSQLCNEKGNPSVQIGMYHFEGSTLTLLNVLNDIAEVYTEPCTVSLTFNIKDLEVKSIKDFRLAYMNEEGQSVDADVCLYNSEIYNDGDNYISEDKCNLCRCVGGVSKCSTDRVCKIDQD